jgi:hypothetical protein
MLYGCKVPYTLEEKEEEDEDEDGESGVEHAMLNKFELTDLVDGEYNWRVRVFVNEFKEEEEKEGEEGEEEEEEDGYDEDVEDEDEEENRGSYTVVRNGKSSFRPDNLYFFLNWTDAGRLRTYFPKFWRNKKLIHVKIFSTNDALNVRFEPFVDNDTIRFTPDPALAKHGISVRATLCEQDPQRPYRSYDYAGLFVSNSHKIYRMKAGMVFPLIIPRPRHEWSALIQINGEGIQPGYVRFYFDKGRLNYEWLFGSPKRTLVFVRCHRIRTAEFKVSIIMPK